MNNKLTDLNNYLFEQLERLNDGDLDLDIEIKRSKTITDVAKCVIDNANLMLESKKYFDNLDFSQKNTPNLFLLGNTNDNNK